MYIKNGSGSTTASTKTANRAAKSSYRNNANGARGAIAVKSNTYVKPNAAVKPAARKIVRAK